MSSILILFLYFWVSSGISVIFYLLISKNCLTRATFSDFSGVEPLEFFTEPPVFIIATLGILLGIIMGPLLWIMVAYTNQQNMKKLIKRPDYELTDLGKRIKQEYGYETDKIV